MTYTGYNAYNRVATTVDSKEMMLVKLLDGTVRFIQAAKSGVDSGNPKIKGENIYKAVSIVTELDCALDREMGGELVDNLSDLYRYILGRLTDANIRSDKQILTEVEELLTTIKDGFSEALKQETSAPVMGQMPSYQTESQRGFNVAA